MRLVATRRIPEGASLARDVLTGRTDAVPLLRAGSQLSPRYREAILRAGVGAVYVDDPIGEGIDVPTAISDSTRQQATRAVAQAFESVANFRETRAPLPDSALRDLIRAAELIAAEIEVSGEVALALGDHSSADSYAHKHAVDVAALGLLLGQRIIRTRGWIDFRGRRTQTGSVPRLAKLGLGLLLHDIGKPTIPAEILNKPGKLTRAEWQLMRAHPLMGLELLTSELISPLVKIVVRSHHERWDGEGYPDGRAGDEINQLARIASVADTFDAITSERVYARARPAHIAVEIVREGAGAAFDPEVVEVFTEIVAPYPPGSDVTLSDGRRGIVAEVPPRRMDRPVVRVPLSVNGAPPGYTDVPLEEYPELAIVAAGPESAHG